MSLMIEYGESFAHEAKKLSKKYKLIKQDIKSAIKEIEEGNFGVPLGSNLFKKRVKNSSIPAGKRGGFRIIIYQKIENRVVLLYIYAKPQKETLSDEELKNLLRGYLHE